jgi:hypothetical protein
VIRSFRDKDTDAIWHRRYVKKLGSELSRLLRVAFDDDDAVIGVDEDLVMGTAPLGVVSGAVVGVVTVLSSR